MPIDYSKIPTADLEALQSGDMKKVSTKTLQYIQSQSSEPKSPELRQGTSHAGFKRALSKVYTPVLEGVGGGLGAAVGAVASAPAYAGGPAGPVATGVATVAGAGLGYAGGKKAATFLDEMAGIGHDEPQPQTPLQGSLQTFKDVMTGSELEMGGQLLGAGGGVMARKVQDWRLRGTPLSNKLAKSRAGEFLADRTEPINELDSTTRAKNKLASRGVVQRTGVNEPSMSQMGEIGLEAPENAYMAQDTHFGLKMRLRDDVITDQARGNVKTKIPGERGGETIQTKLKAFKDTAEQNAKSAEGKVQGLTSQYASTTDDQTAGEQLVSTIKKKMEPIKAKETEAWEAVPNYPMPAENFAAESSRIKSTPMFGDTEGVVNDAISYADKTFAKFGRNADTMHKVESTIGSKMRSTNDRDVRRVLGELKTAINKDFDAMGTAAEKGDVALHEGEIVYPSRMKTDLDIAKKRLATAQEKTPPDMAKILTTLREKKIPSMRQNQETEQSFISRMTKEYERATGQKAPTTQSEDVTKFAKDVSDLEGKLANLKPAEDVAKAYSTAKGLSKARFDRFSRGSLEDVLERGNESTGQKTTYENVPAKFRTPSGADDLIRAMGSREEAAAAMHDHFAADFISRSQNPVTREINPKVASRWLDKNRSVLKKYGLYDEFASVRNAQGIADQAKANLDNINKSIVSKVLETEPENAINYALGSKSPEQAMMELKAAGKGDQQYLQGLKSAFRDHMMKASSNTGEDLLGADKASAAKAKKLIGDKYQRAMKVLYSPQERQSLEDYAQIVKMLNRNKNVTFAGGPSTAEKLYGGVKTETIFDRVTNAGVRTNLSVTGNVESNILSSVKNIVVGALKGLKEADIHLVDEYVKDALLNPQEAHDMIQLAKGNRSKLLLNRIVSDMNAQARVNKARAVEMGVKGGGGGDWKEIGTDEE